MLKIYTKKIITMNKLKLISFLIFLTAVLSGNVFAQTTLKDAFKDYFLIGAAMNRSQILGKDSRGVAIVKEQFDTISPENDLKWESVHREPGKYNFEIVG